MSLRKRIFELLLAALPVFAALSNTTSDDGTSLDYTSISSTASTSVEHASIQVKFPNNTGSSNNSTETCPKKTGKRKLSAYFPNYNADERPLSGIRYDLYDELSFFVAVTTEDFTFGPGEMNQTYWDSLAFEFVDRCKKASVEPWGSVGGWTGSRYFSTLVATAENRTAFAQSAVQFAKKYGFLGLDCDWEYPIIQGIGCNTVSDDDVTNWQLWLKKIKELWPEGKLSAAVSIAGIRDSDYRALPASNLTSLVDVLDKLKIMAYDVHGSWTPTTGPLAPIRGTCAASDNQLSVESAVDVYLRQGFDPSQLILGIPGYAKSWTLASPELSAKVVQNYTTYYYQNFTGIPPGGQFDDKPGIDVCGQPAGWGGSWLVSELVSNGFLSEDQKSGGAGFNRYYDECSGEPFLLRNTTFISYDDTHSTLKKVEFAKSKDLGGVFFFDTNGPLDTTVSAARDSLLSDS